MEINFGFEASASQETGRQINSRLQVSPNAMGDKQEESKSASTATGSSSSKSH